MLRSGQTGEAYQSREVTFSATCAHLPRADAPRYEPPATIWAKVAPQFAHPFQSNVIRTGRHPEVLLQAADVIKTGERWRILGSVLRAPMFS
jgi:hypothetical protein